MTYYYGINGSNGLAGSAGTNSPNSGTPATAGGNGAAGVAGTDYVFDMDQLNYDVSVNVTAGYGGGGGSGGQGGSGTYSYGYTYESHGITTNATATSTAGARGGNGGAAGSGGLAHVIMDGVVAPQDQYLYAAGYGAYGGGSGGGGGSGVSGSYVTNPYASGYYDSGSVFHYVGYTETSPGSAGGAGGTGAVGGSGGDALVEVLNNNFSLQPSTYQPYVSATGYYGSTGGNGGSGGSGATGGLAGNGGRGGDAGDAAILVSNNLGRFGGTVYLTALGYTGGAGGAGGHGGAGFVSRYTYTAPGVYTLTYDRVHGAGGVGADGGTGGSASINYSGNTVLGTAADETLGLNFSLTAGEGGAGGAGGTNGDYSVTAAAGAKGASGTTQLGFTGNVFNGGFGTDTLNLSITNKFANATGYTALGAVYINLDTGVFKIGTETSSILNVENVTLTQLDGYTGPGGTVNFVAGATLIGSADSNVLKGSLGNDAIQGGGGDDNLDGGAGADDMRGGTGNDTYVVDNIGDTIVETINQGYDIVNSSVSFVLGSQYIENLTLTGYNNINGTGNGLNNNIVGNSYVNILNGGVGDDSLSGAGGMDSLIGGTGNDRLDGGSDADSMNGGANNDTYIVDNIGDVVIEGLNAGTDTVISNLSYVLPANVENLLLNTGYGSLNATGNNLANMLVGNGYDNVLDGLTGADLMIGGSGNDTYNVDVVGDVVSEAPGQGTDTVISAIDYVLGTELEKLTLVGNAVLGTGNASTNTIIGNAGNNTLDGKAGTDTMFGMAGNDLYYVDNVGDVVREDSVLGVDDGGSDRVYTTVTFTLGEFVENMTMQGVGNINGKGNDGVNNIVGNGGNNRIEGKGGNDNMLGGAGNDTFVFAHFGSANGTDYVSDFVSGIDVLSFTAADFGWTAGHVLTAAEYQLNAASGAAAQFVFNTVNSTLYWDTNGATAGGLVAIVRVGASTPVVGDFVFT